MKQTCLLLLLFHLSCLSQSRAKDSVPVYVFKSSMSDYRDFVILGEQLYALNKGDSLIIWNIRKEKVEKVVASVSAITKGRNGKILCSKSSGEIVEVSNKRQWKSIGQFMPEAKVYNMVIDNEGYPALLTNKGVLYKDILHVPPVDTPFYNKMSYSWPSKVVHRPNVIFLDREQRIWMGYDRGEWGGDQCFFDLKTKEFYFSEFLELKYLEKYVPENDTLGYLKQYEKYAPTFIELQKDFSDDFKISGNDTLTRLRYVTNFNHARGIAQDDWGNIYVSNSLFRTFASGDLVMLRGDGTFYKSRSLKTVLRHKEHINRRNNKKWIEAQEEPEAVTFNPYDKSIYYYSSDGFFKLVEHDGVYSAEFILMPYVRRIGIFPYSGRYRVKVPKFEFVSKEKFIFLTDKNGIGYYKGSEVVYFK